MAEIITLDTSGSQEYEYTCIESVSTSAGAGDSGKIPELDGSGKLDASFLPDSVINGYDWKESVRVAQKTNINLAAPGATVDGVALSVGDRFLAAGQTTGSENGIYVYQGAATPATRATDHDEDAEMSSGNRMFIEEGNCAEQVATLTTNDPITVGATSTTYGFQSSASLTGGDGITITANVVAVDLVADGGLEINGGQLQGKTADTSVAADLDGTNGIHYISAQDLSSNGANQGAKVLGFDPANCATFTTTNIQAAMDELCAAVEAGASKTATVGAGGVTKGDALYISADNTVQTYPNNTNDKVIGYAATTQAAAATVAILPTTGSVLTGVLAGATAGDKYYWDGTNHSTTVPSAAGTRVIRTGVALNATDLCVDTEFLKKNA